MEDVTKRKLAAAGTVAFGAGRIAMGLATATGRGLMASMLGSHHMLAAGRIAADGIESGTRMIDDGIAEWRAAST
jgi:hypothetical protein